MGLIISFVLCHNFLTWTLESQSKLKNSSNLVSNKNFEQDTSI